MFKLHAKDICKSELQRFLIMLILAGLFVFSACEQSGNARASSTFEVPDTHTVETVDKVSDDSGPESGSSAHGEQAERQISKNKTDESPGDGKEGDLLKSDSPDKKESQVSQAPDSTRTDEKPEFSGTFKKLPEDVRKHMTGRSWREGCPVSLDDLVLLQVSHWNMEGEVVEGEMVVAFRAADALLKVFERLFEIEFPIERMRRIDFYEGDDKKSMDENNSSAFNCRYVAGTKRWSEHSFGTAVDINPIQNPWVRGDRVEPPAGREYLDRNNVRPGMMVPGEAVDAFRKIGWKWGGNWSRSKDYQHFSESGR